MGADSTIKKTSRIKRPLSVYRLMEWTATILLLLIFVAAVATLIFPVSHPILVKKVSKYLKDSGADSSRVGNVTIKIWQGIEISDFYVDKEISSHEKYSFSAEKITVKVNILSSIFLKKSRELPVKGKEYLFYELYREPKYYLGEWFRFLNQYKTFRGLSVIEPDVTITGFDSLDIEMNGGVVDLDNDCEKKEMNVQYQIGSSKINGLLFEYNKGVVSIDENNLKIIRSKGRCFNGKYKMTGDIDVYQYRIRTLEIGVTGFEMSSLRYITNSSGGRLGGDIDFDVKLEPSAFHYDSLRGDGVLVIENTVITGTSFQRSLKNLIMSPLIDTLRFTKIKNEFNLRKNLTFFNKTQGSGSEIDFSAKGWIRPDGSLNQNIEAVFNESFVRKMAPVAANSLIVGDNGDRIFRCKVYGNSASPRVELDSIVLKRAIGSVFNEMKENFKHLFRKMNYGE
ncbi:MAG: hypothetical protein JW915_23350 [Chitinispirillaceae bacterium]|nr:hypothetical protein [Chitinispirillaceae bacterium]